MSQEKREEASIALTRLFLFQQARQQPLKKEIIRAYVFEKLGLSMSLFEVIMDEAGEMLRSTFAMEICKLPGKPGQFILVNHRPNAFKKLIHQYDKGRKGFDESGLLGFLLCFVAMSENKLSQAFLGQIFIKFGLSPDNESQTFGDLNELISRWTRHGYLETTKLNATSNAPGEDLFYSWGPRARAEFPIEKLSHFIAKIYGTTETKSISQYLERTINSQQ